MELLVRQLKPSCTDLAIQSLEVLGNGDRDGRLWNDLSAAYYVRAQRRDAPLDLARAFEAVQRALAIDPWLPEARFNLALVLDELGLRRRAMQAWDVVRRDGNGGWAEEAAERHATLLRAETKDAGSSGALLRVRLNSVILAGDREAIATFIQQNPSAVHQFVEDEMLPAWARAKEEREADRQYEMARMVAEMVARMTGDRYLVDAVARLTAARGMHDGATIAALREGHLAFAEARAARQMARWSAAVREYERAEAAFSRTGSPLRAHAAIAAADVRSLTAPSDRDAGRLAAVVEFARTHRYGYLLVRALGTRASLLQRQGRVVDALDLYTLAAASRLQTYEDVTLARVRRISLLREIGQEDLAWREAFEAIRMKPHTEPGTRNLLLGESASALSASGHGETALLYQGALIQELEDSLADRQPESVDAFRRNLSVAMRARAEIEIRLGRLDRARFDLIEAHRLSGAKGEEGELELARIAEIRGKALLPARPREAVEAFTQALVFARAASDTFYRADLLAQRAAAYRIEGDRVAAERDLTRSAEEIRVGEQLLLQNRTRGVLYRSYFGRYTDIYRSLSFQLAGAGRIAEAFAYSEKASLAASSAFVDQVRGPQRLPTMLEAVDLGGLQKALPPETVLLDYLVDTDWTHVWVVSSRRVEFLSLPVGSAAIARWARQLRIAAEIGNADAFERGLGAPYAGLLAEPLRRMAQGPGAPIRTLIFLTRSAMRGLPLAALRDEVRRRYLIEDYAIGTAESATQYVGCLFRDRAIHEKAEPQILLMGDPAFNPTSELARGFRRIPYAQVEVAQIGALYAPYALVRSGGASTASALLELAPKSLIVHLAVPFVPNVERPSQSVLLLAPSKKNAGALSYEELFRRIRLTSTRLVVLSACSTSSSGSELDSHVLSAAFLDAGTPAVVGSLWAVGDSDTADFMTAFHREYRRGADVAGALRTVQLRRLSDPRSGRLGGSLSWATWQVLGAASSRLETPNVFRSSGDVR